jgi:hypothetical protein
MSSHRQNQCQSALTTKYDWDAQKEMTNNQSLSISSSNKNNEWCQNGSHLISLHGCDGDINEDKEL